uniref:Putative immobilization antigen isoform n=1 Tax=Ichthyophthirius multifiliis TaxID=5932 RepID=A0A7G7YAH9_ICHMU|nr:putative immobilization antigen isoform [Ichthyophthirius multifiliis]
MKYNILIILIISLFINELRALNCPAGTQTQAGLFEDGDLANCTHCRANFYYNGGNPAGDAVGAQAFTPGAANATGQCVACQVNREGSAGTQGAATNLATQCSVACPAGTAVADGQTLNFALSVTQCTHCRANFYYNGGNPAGDAVGAQAFTPGAANATGQCVACQVNREGSVGTQGAAANLATQCSVACPAGTAVADGQTLNFALSVTQCTHCRANFYYNGDANFVAGTNQCTACPVGANKGADAAAAQGNAAKIKTQCNVLCPTGTSNANGDTFWTAAITDCVNCAANFYFNGAFNAGTSQCIQCPVSKANPATAPGGSASLSTQCNSACPTGTVLDDGTTTNYTTQANQCTKCAVNFFASKTTGFVAGTDTCTECTKKLTSGATAKVFAEATQKIQCAATTFAKFLSISLLFVSFYLL